MKVKVTIDLADKAQAAAFQNLVSAQAAAAQQKPMFLEKGYGKGGLIPTDHTFTAERVLSKELEEQYKADIAQYAEANPPPTDEDVVTLMQPATKKTRAPRKTQAAEEQPADTAAAENVEVNEPEEVTDAATNIFAEKLAAKKELAEEVVHDEKPNNPVEYTEQEVRQLVADKVNAHRPVIVAKLNALGSKSVTLLPKEKYGELVAFLNGLD